jgi:hypothetical protein
MGSSDGLPAMYTWVNGQWDWSKASVCTDMVRMVNLEETGMRECILQETVKEQAVILTQVVLMKMDR